MGNYDVYRSGVFGETMALLTFQTKNYIPALL